MSSFWKQTPSVDYLEYELKADLEIAAVKRSCAAVLCQLKSFKSPFGKTRADPFVNYRHQFVNLIGNHAETVRNRVVVLKNASDVKNIRRFGKASTLNLSVMLIKRE